jgi:hypothetical protein
MQRKAFMDLEINDADNSFGDTLHNQSHGDAVPDIDEGLIALLQKYVMTDASVWIKETHQGELRYYLTLAEQASYSPLSASQLYAYLVKQVRSQRYIRNLTWVKHDDKTFQQFDWLMKHANQNEILSQDLYAKRSKDLADVAHALSSVQLDKIRKKNEPKVQRSSLLDNPDEAPHYIRRSKGGARWLLEGYYQLGIYPVWTKFASYNPDTGRFTSRYQWRAICIFCQNKKCDTGLNMIIEDDGPKYCCIEDAKGKTEMTDKKSWSHHTKEEFAKFLASEVKHDKEWKKLGGGRRFEEEYCDD